MQPFLQLSDERLSELDQLAVTAASGDEAAQDALADLDEREMAVYWRVVDQRHKRDAANAATAKTAAAGSPEPRGMARISAALAGGRGA